MSQDEMAEKGLQELLAFFQRGSSYDVLQARHGSEWGAAWTFAPCDVHAAEKAAWMLRRTGVREIRHARRARLRVRANAVERVVIVTELPERGQVVILLGDGCVIGSLPYLKDDALAALEAAFAPSAEITV